MIYSRFRKYTGKDGKEGIKEQRNRERREQRNKERREQTKEGLKTGKQEERKYK
jgi:hypothetical protein